MAFGKKKTIDSSLNQDNVALRATEALEKVRSSRLLLGVRIVFVTPVLMHRWSQKAIVQMLGKMAGQEMPRPPKDVTADFNESWYRNTEGKLAMPCRLVKACIVEGAISTMGLVSKAELKRDLRVRGYTAPVKMPAGGELEMDTRIASNNGSPDIRSRAVVPTASSIDVVLDFPVSMSPDKVMAALTSAGASIGLCDWRPEKGGEYGSFEVTKIWSEKKEIDRVLRECSVAEDTYEIPPELLRAVNAIAPEKKTDAQRKATAVVEHVNGQARRSRTAQA
jgi:hypothetical protein